MTLIFRLGDSKVYTIHIYANESGVGTAGIYLPQGFGRPTFAGDGTIYAVHRSGMVIGITHLDVNSQKDVNRNYSSGRENGEGSRYIGNIGTGGGSEGYRHVHAHLYPSLSARTTIKQIKSGGMGMRDPTVRDSRYLLDVRTLLRR